MARSRTRGLNPRTVRRQWPGGRAGISASTSNWDKAGAEGVPINSPSTTTISTAFGSAYVSTTSSRAERVKKRLRSGRCALIASSENDLNKLYVRNNGRKDGSPYSSFASTGLLELCLAAAANAINGFPSLNICGRSGPGPEFRRRHERPWRRLVPENCPPGIGYDWTGTFLSGAHGDRPRAASSTRSRSL